MSDNNAAAPAADPVAELQARALRILQDVHAALPPEAREKLDSKTYQGDFDAGFKAYVDDVVNARVEHEIGRRSANQPKPEGAATPPEPAEAPAAPPRRYSLADIEQMDPHEFQTRADEAWASLTSAEERDAHEKWLATQPPESPVQRRRREAKAAAQAEAKAAAQAASRKPLGELTARDVENMSIEEFTARQSELLDKIAPRSEGGQYSWRRGR